MNRLDDPDDPVMQMNHVFNGLQGQARSYRLRLDLEADNLALNCLESLSLELKGTGVTL